MRPISLIAAVSFLAACAIPSPAPAPIAYTCEDGSVLNVRFVENAAYVTVVGGQELYLPQFTAASGIWYATPQYELRGKGDEATWTVGRRVPTVCRVRR